MAPAPDTHRVLRGLRRLSPPDTWLKLVSDDAHGTQHRPGCRGDTTRTYSPPSFPSSAPEIAPAIPKQRCEFAAVLRAAAVDQTAAPQRNSCSGRITRCMTDARAGRGVPVETDLSTGASGGGESPALRPAKSRHVPVPFPSPRSCPLGAVAARLASESHEPFLARSLSNATHLPSSRPHPSLP